MDQNDAKSNPKYLYFSVIILNLSSFAVGSAFAWSSPSLPRLNGQVDPANNPLPEPITTTEASLIASLIAIGAIVSPLPACLCADKFGRKLSLMAAVVPLFASFTVIIFARTVLHFYIARFIAGLAIGAIFSILPNYVAELSEKTNRGSMGCLFVVNITMGNLLIYAIGPYFPIKYAGVACLVAPTLFLIMTWQFVPESPYYLMAKGRYDEAEESLLVLRMGADVAKELGEVNDSVKESCGGILSLFQDGSLLKRLVITLGLVTFQQFSGVNAILFYMQTLFNESGSTLAPELSTIIVAVVQFLAAFVTPLLVDRLGRRFLLFTAGFGTLFSLMAIGAFFYIKRVGGDYEAINWLPICCLITYILSYSLGFGPVPFVILGEIFPPNFKAAASTITIMLCFSFTFCTTVFFPAMMNFIGTAESFWLFAFCCGVSLFFVYFLVPETKGKPLIEIQRRFK